MKPLSTIQAFAAGVWGFTMKKTEYYFCNRFKSILFVKLKFWWREFNEAMTPSFI